MGGAALFTEDDTDSLCFTHDLEHTCAAFRALAFHGFASVRHGYFTGLFHIALGLALHAITFNFCCHFPQGFSYRPIGLN